MKAIPRNSASDLQAGTIDCGCSGAHHDLMPPPTTSDLPFSLPVRPAVRQLRGAGAEPPDLRETTRQTMAGFEPRFTDIVDYIVRITDEIWLDRAVGYIYETYAASCVVYSPYGVVRSVEEVIASTVASLNAAPDGAVQHLNVAWSSDEPDGFYTSHLGLGRSTNLGRTNFGPATGRRTEILFAADCISKDNRIHTEWLVRDNGAAVRQLGFDPHEVAKRLASVPPRELLVIAPEARLEGQTARQRLDVDRTTLDGWARGLFDDVWNLRRLDWLAHSYSPDVMAHGGGGRAAKNLRDYQRLVLHVLAAIPDGVMRVHHVCHSDEADGTIVAVRWTLEGMSAPGGILGECPPGRRLALMGISHLRLSGGKVVEEWMLFDEIGALVQVYRA